MSPVADVLGRIADIESRFGVPSAPANVAGASASGFAGALAGAMGGDGAPSGADVVADARRYLGVRYKWGGTNPATGLDCSGFVQRVYGDLGVSLPRVAADQARAGRAVPSLAQARPGDLIAFGWPVDHIGIYVGDGKMIVAPHTGDVVKIQDITRTPTAIRRIVPDNPINTGGSVGATAGGALAGGAGGLGQLFAQAGARHGVPAGLLAAVAKVESGFNPRAVSSAGAQGLMQLMPGTAKGLGVDPFDPAQAIEGAARLISSYQQQFGSTELALAAYNAGPGAVSRYGGVPPYAETQRYVQRVLAQMESS